MHTTIQTLFDALWRQYLEVTPSALKIHQLLGQGGPIINDHVAFRTFNLAPVGLERLAAHFTSLGYQAHDEYQFKAKKLYARYYQHPDPDQPKVFISELLTEQCSPSLQRAVQALVAQVPPDRVSAEDFLYSGRLWQVDSTTYRQLLAESEYAAWLAAFGYRANHFTVSVNRLAQTQSLAEVNELLKAAGFELNRAGGEIKGSAEVMLEQSSTLADRVQVAFTDRSLAIPSCFYEFARRYPMADGALYQGFVEASADKIFESTDAAG